MQANPQGVATFPGHGRKPRPCNPATGLDFPPVERKSDLTL